MRKVFVTGAPASKTIEKHEYLTTENCRVSPCGEVFFPVTMVMETMIDGKDTDEYEVIVVSYGTDYAKANIESLRLELKERGFRDSVRTIYLPGDDAEMSRKMLMELIDAIHQGDDLYVNIEFGKRPILMTMLYGIEIVDNGLDDVEVNGIFYGERRNYVEPTEYILHDVSYLYYLGQVVSDLEIESEDDLKQRISKILSLGIGFQSGK